MIQASEQFFLYKTLNNLLKNDEKIKGKKERVFQHTPCTSFQNFNYDDLKLKGIRDLESPVRVVADPSPPGNLLSTE